LTFDDNSAQKQKSDKITFSKLNLLPLKFGGNACFLKNYGISVVFLTKTFVNALFSQRQILSDAAIAK